MKKLTLCLIAVAAIGAAAAMAATKVTVFAEPGPRALDTVDVAKPVYVEVINALPATGTVTVSRVVGNVTNTFVTAPCTDGAYAAPITTTNYLLRGDTLLRGGSVTSGVVRVLNEAD